MSDFSVDERVALMRRVLAYTKALQAMSAELVTLANLCADLPAGSLRGLLDDDPFALDLLRALSGGVQLLEAVTRAEQAVLPLLNALGDDHEALALYHSQAAAEASGEEVPGVM
jgi:hypothetical protein